MQAALREIGGTDRERHRPADRVRGGAHDQLRGASADIDDAELAGGRVPEGPSRTEECQPGLLLSGEDGDLDAALPGDRLDERLAVRGPPDRGGRKRPHLDGPEGLRGSAADA